MKKVIGDIEITTWIGSDSVNIEKTCNESVSKEITIRGIYEVEDLIHVLTQVKRELEARGRSVCTKEKDA